VAEALVLGIVVLTALAFDFTNGFHDTGNAMAPTIATRALKPKQAVMLAAVLNLVGAFLSLSVAATIAKGIVDAEFVTLPVVLAGLAGGIVWNLLTWLLGLPSSSSHALVGGVVGAVIAGIGINGVHWDGLAAKVMVPALVAPVVAILVAATGTAVVTRITRSFVRKESDRSFRWGQIGSASLMALAHGTNDAQKTMGIILLALIAAGSVPADSSVPFWVIVSCALAMALGTYMGGWRVIKTLGKGLVRLDTRQGMAADASSASVILLSSHFGYSLSTTHVASGSILGTGIGRRGAKVQWGVAGKMLVAWLVTVPAAAAVGAIFYGIGAASGEIAGAFVVFGLLVIASGVIWWLSRRKPVHADDMNDDWDPEASEESIVADAVRSHNPRLMRVRNRERKHKKKHKKKHKSSSKSSKDKANAKSKERKERKRKEKKRKDGKKSKSGKKKGGRK
jgi:PiT family inorganic phosphate transporter